MGRKRLIRNYPENKPIIEKYSGKYIKLAKQNSFRSLHIPIVWKFKADKPPPKEILDKLEPIWEKKFKIDHIIYNYREKQKPLESLEMVCNIKKKESLCNIIPKKKNEIIPELEKMENEITTKITELKKFIKESKLPKNVNSRYTME